MMEREWRPPRWGPTVDPPPWQWWGPAVDPPPWGWGGRVGQVPLGSWYKRFAEYPQWGPVWDPPPHMLEDLFEKIKPRDLAALHQARLEMVQTQLQAEMRLIARQMEILKQYLDVQ